MSFIRGLCLLLCYPLGAQADPCLTYVKERFSVVPEAAFLNGLKTNLRSAFQAVNRTVPHTLEADILSVGSSVNSNHRTWAYALKLTHVMIHGYRLMGSRTPLLWPLLKKAIHAHHVESHPLLSSFTDRHPGIELPIELRQAWDALRQEAEPGLSHWRVEFDFFDLATEHFQYRIQALREGQQSGSLTPNATDSILERLKTEIPYFVTRPFFTSEKPSAFVVNPAPESLQSYRYGIFSFIFNHVFTRSEALKNGLVTYLKNNRLWSLNPTRQLMLLYGYYELLLASELKSLFNSIDRPFFELLFSELQGLTTHGQTWRDEWVFLIGSPGVDALFHNSYEALVASRLQAISVPGGTQPLLVPPALRHEVLKLGRLPTLPHLIEWGEQVTHQGVLWDAFVAP